MKRYLIRALILFNSLLFSFSASAGSASAELLQQMRNAMLDLNYELSFINITRGNIESLRYRHAVVNDKALAQLLQMDGPAREILMRDSVISYFLEQGGESFSISGDHILDDIPTIAFADFSRLANYYDFIPIGRARVANQICQVIRVVAKDGHRFSYAIWIDRNTKLPLQIELLDRNNETIEQFRVTSFVVGDGVKDSLKGLLNLQLPPILSGFPVYSDSINWYSDWLPEGFNEISSSHRHLANIDETVQTRLFSDGLFSFSVNVMLNERDTPNQILNDGRRTIYAETRNGREIVIVGEIPQTTAKRIADGVVFAQ